MTTQPGTSGDTRLASWPPFVRELDATLSVHAQYVLWGNLHDSFLTPAPDGGGHGSFPPRDLLWETCAQRLLLHGRYDRVDGIQITPPRRPGRGGDAAASLFGGRGRRAEDPSLEGLPAAWRAGPAHPGHPRRFRHRLASRIARGPDRSEPAERDFFVFCEKLSRTARPYAVTATGRSRCTTRSSGWPGAPATCRRGLPPTTTRSARSPSRAPHLGDRQQTARLLARAFETTGPELDVTDDFAQEAEGLTLQAMIEITRLAKERDVPWHELPDAVRTYKLGVLDNPWKREHLRRRIVDGEERVPARVVGQPQAVTKTLDILKRAVLGLSGAQAPGHQPAARRTVLRRARPASARPSWPRRSPRWCSATRTPTSGST